MGDQKDKAATARELTVGDLTNRAVAAQDKGDVAKARRLYNESLEISRRLGDQSSIASTLHQLAMLAQAEDKSDEARRLYGESLEIKKRLGDQRGIAITLHQFGVLAEIEGDKAEATRLFCEALDFSRNFAHPMLTLHVEVWRGWRVSLSEVRIKTHISA